MTIYWSFFNRGADESGNSYCMKHITAPRGSLILWDSRTVHWNQHPSKDRLYLQSENGWLFVLRAKGKANERG